MIERVIRASFGKPALAVILALAGTAFGANVLCTITIDGAKHTVIAAIISHD